MTAVRCMRERLPEPFMRGHANVAEVSRLDGDGIGDGTGRCGRSEWCAVTGAEGAIDNRVGDVAKSAAMHGLATVLPTGATLGAT
jgi:hypothetical protein